MWQLAVLQIFFALLPIVALQFWLNRPAGDRHASVFIAAASGLSMLLCAVDSDGPNRFGLQSVPYLIGSLYGGLSAASVLTLLFAAIRAGQSSDIYLLAVEGVFLAVLAALMLRRIPAFRDASRREKIRLSAWLAAVGAAFPLLDLGASLPARNGSAAAAVTAGAFAVLAVEACVVSSVYVIESGLRRTRLESDLRLMTEKFRGEEHRLQRFIDLAPLAVVFIDTDGNITHLNELALKFLSPYPRREVVGRSYRSVFGLFGDEAVGGAVGRVLGGDKEAVHMLRFRNRLHFVTVSELRLAPSDPSEGAVLIAHDVTELERLKDEVGKMERLSLVGQMAASITHEIRNPMAVIRGFVQLLKERSHSDQQSYFHIILQELDRANSIISDFLSLAQNRVVEKSSCDLHEVLEDLQPLIQADANMRGQLLELALCDRMEPLELNVKEIKQLVLNLSRNGMEAMNDKGVLRIETRNLEDAVELRVIDNGVGIPPERLHHLFEPFYTTKTNGTGLGLALCLSIVERHNGKIRVESKLGEGTAFIVTFGKPGRERSVTGA